MDLDQTLNLKDKILDYIQNNANKATEDDLYLLGVHLNCSEIEISNALNSLLQDRKILSVWFNEQGSTYKEKTWGHTHHGYTIRANDIINLLNTMFK